MFRNGQVAKREYRGKLKISKILSLKVRNINFYMYSGQRSEESLAEFVRTQLNSAIIDFKNNAELEEKIIKSKRKIIASFASPQGPAYDNFVKVVQHYEILQIIK